MFLSFFNNIESDSFNIQTYIAYQYAVVELSRLLLILYCHNNRVGDTQEVSLIFTYIFLQKNDKLIDFFYNPNWFLFTPPYEI